MFREIYRCFDEFDVLRGKRMKQKNGSLINPFFFLFDFVVGLEASPRRKERVNHDEEVSEAETCTGAIARQDERHARVK